MEQLLKMTGFLALVILISCDGESEEKPFGFEKPSHFPEPTYTFDNNPISKEGFELGRFIFNDPILSRDGTISCASCHDQTVAFADPQHRLSVGIESRVGIRNAPPIFNLAFYDNFFWDGGVTHVDFIPLNAIANPLEMDENVDLVIQKMNADSAYRRKFEEAFGPGEINVARFLHAIAQFMTMMVSANSDYDQFITDGKTLSSEAMVGLALFEEHCESCHSGALFTDQSFRNNGLDSEFKDLGRSLITENDSDHGKFKVPSLRNIALTAPYMHDGRFTTLDEVLVHYSQEVEWSNTLDPILNDGAQLGLALTLEERNNIISFLETLTDQEFTSNPLFFAP